MVLPGLTESAAADRARARTSAIRAIRLAKGWGDRPCGQASRLSAGLVTRSLAVTAQVLRAASYVEEAVRKKLPVEIWNSIMNRLSLASGGSWATSGFPPFARCVLHPHARRRSFGTTGYRCEHLVNECVSLHLDAGVIALEFRDSSLGSTVQLRLTRRTKPEKFRNITLRQ